jgi:hypothetical protein
VSFQTASCPDMKVRPLRSKKCKQADDRGLHFEVSETSEVLI